MSILSKIAGIICVSVILSSCVPAALLVGATAGGAIVYDKRSMKTIMHDNDAKAQAEINIRDTAELQKESHISVAVFNQVMLLVGQVATNEQRDLVSQRVASVKYVSRVYNEITVQPPTSFAQRSKDSWITTKVRTAMLAKSGLGSTQIKVVTEDSVVYLMGIVSPNQADLAADVARHVDDVKRVVKVFENQK